IVAPEPFDCSRSEEWARWSRRFERFRSVSGLAEKSGESKVNTLVYYMGDSADNILESFGLGKEEQKDYLTVHDRVQEEGEPVEIFITALHKLVATCEYKTLHDEMIQDRIVVGIHNQALSERMQLDKKLTLESATKLARENEAVKMQQTEM
uniref:Uncharacterized protein n=1 Tax=Amphimedon queenslandica TaxID=400682 RepID=A0A1X7UWW3_AMPQE